VIIIFGVNGEVSFKLSTVICCGMFFWRTATSQAHEHYY